ncbi:MAG TPA: hypothetical protein VKF16_07895, partial [Candidatus Dormibacteraeota bacterium]|nr:hypothetical protein [Candidatus Dormibacteraeota bacterium]
RVRTHVYDLILSDLHMQVMDGPTFYRRMQVEHPDIVERIVFMTSQGWLERAQPGSGAAS